MTRNLSHPRSEEQQRVRDRLDALTGEPAVDEPADEQADERGWSGEQVARPIRWIPERLRDARLNPGRGGAAVLAVVGLLAAVIGGIVVARDRPVVQPVPPLPVVNVSAAGSSGSPAPDRPAELVVSVVGQVVRGGLVRLPPGSRVADALAAAGGPNPGTDTLGLNLAQKVNDGDQIVVGGPPGTGPPAPETGTPAATGAQPTGGKLDLNRATEQELDSLPGVGPVTAKAIVAWRSSNGRFTDVEQLGEVDGIGPGRLAKLRELVAV